MPSPTLAAPLRDQLARWCRHLDQLRSSPLARRGVTPGAPARFEHSWLPSACAVLRRQLRSPPGCGFVGALALVGVLTPLTGNGQAASEYEVKGAFIARFASFIEWPADTFQEPTSPLTVCVAGKSAFDNGLAATINSSRVGDRPLRAERHSATSRCQILFVAASDQKNLAAMLPTLGDATVTVGEQARFLETGGAIEFRADGNRLQFDVNLRVIERARYRISSKLLVLARRADASAARE